VTAYPRSVTGPHLLNAVTPRNLLSFGPDNEPLELNCLNVLIGPNGSGKSNLLEAIALLRTCPNREGFRKVIARGGGIGEWIWKGHPNEPASVEALVARSDGWPLRHRVALRKEQQSFRLEDERIENERPAKGKPHPYLFYHYGHGRPVINTVSGKKRQLNRDDVAPDASILAQRQDPDSFPEITRLATVYDRIKLLVKCGLAGRMPRLVACGGRGTAFDHFVTAHETAIAGEYLALLIDKVV